VGKLRTAYPGGRAGQVSQNLGATKSVGSSAQVGQHQPVPSTLLGPPEASAVVHWPCHGWDIVRHILAVQVHPCVVLECYHPVHP